MLKRPSRPRLEWKLPELAEAAGVSARTVRYYVQRGLLPPPRFRGPDTVYEARHLHRLRAIRRLQDAFLPLDVIQEELATKSEEEVARLADGEALPGFPRALPSPASEPAEPAPAGASWKRWELAPGLELHLADGAGARVRELAERLRGAALKNEKES